MSLYRTYRPQTFKEVTGQHHVVTPVRHQLETDTLAHAYLFSGPRGIGKTTIARLIAKASNCLQPDGVEPCGTCGACQAIVRGSSMDVIEIDAASHTGVDNVRENIIDNVRFAPTQLKRKVFIIDEVHMLSKGAFNALLKTLEEPPTYATFILATTELHKIPDTIVSRCQRFDFTNVPAELVVERLDTIAKQEGVKVDAPVLSEIARRSGGHVRDAVSLLEQIMSLDAKHVTADVAQTVMPVVDVQQTFAFIQLLVAKDTERAVRQLNASLDAGIEPLQFVREITQLLRLGLLKHMGEMDDATYTHEQQVELMRILQEAGAERTATLLKRFLDAEALYGRYPYHLPQLGLELAILDVCGAAPAAPVQAPPVKQEDRVEPVTVEVKTESVTPTPDPVKIEVNATDDANVNTSITLEQVKKYWSAFQRTLRERHASLPLALEMAEPLRVDDGRVMVKVQFEFYAETVNTPKNNTFLAQILSEVIGERVGVQGVYQNIETEPEVASVLEAFGGTVVNQT